MKNLSTLLLIFLVSCSSSSKSMDSVAIVEQSSKMSQEFSSDTINGRKAFENFEENQYKDAVQEIIERHKNKKPCKDCLKAYFSSLKYYKSSAAEFHVEQLSYFVNNHTNEVTDLCNSLNPIDRSTLQSMIKTAYQMSQISIKKEKISSCISSSK